MTNCPAVYRNIQCESFGDKKKITSQMLRQFCKNDAYLYNQVMALWDETDPKSKKRFYPPDYMDVSRSFGIESYILTNETDLATFKYFNTVYRFNTADRYNFVFDFNGSYDKTVEERTNDGSLVCINVLADSYLDIENSYNEQLLEIVQEDGVTTLRPPLVEGSYEEIIHHDAVYTTCQKKIKSGYTTKGKYVTTKKEKLGKAKKDAHFYGAFGNWDCNNHWYNGFDRTKNYNVKSAWKKDPYNDDATLTKKYGRIPSVCHSQTFKAQNSGRISKVNLNIQGSKNAVSPCVVEIRTTSKKGYPTSKVLARVEKKFSGSGENIVAFEFKTKPQVEKGKTYAIVVRSPLSKFENTYRLGGWTTGCFSSESKYYSGGSAFTSLDNGKSWTKNGKTSDTKSYGSHYYDWGINQKPIDFAFEVYVQPITQKAVKEYVKGKKVNAVYESYNKLTKEAYDEKHTYKYNYFKEGSYYLHLKPIQLSPIDSFTITDTYTDANNLHYSPYWAWEYYDPSESEWVEVDGNTVNFNNSETNYTVLKLRIRCDITQSTLTEVTSRDGVSNYDCTIMDELTSANKLATTSLTYLKNTGIEIRCRKPTKAYLRTKYYHPIQDQMLGANIWSEVDITASQKNPLAELKVDIIHEREAVEHFKFYDLGLIESINTNDETTIIVDEALDIFNTLLEHIHIFENSETFRATTGMQIIDYLYDDVTNNGKKFVKYLQGLVTPIYILPSYYLIDGALKLVTYFDYLQLSHYPAYPLLGGDVGDDDIIIDPTLFNGISDYGAYYSLPNANLTSTLDSIYVSYDVDVETDYVSEEFTSTDDQDQTVTEELVIDEDGFEVEVENKQENIKETLKGIILDHNNVLDDSNKVKNNLFANENTVENGTFESSVDYAITKDGKLLIINFYSPLIKKLFPHCLDPTPNMSLAQTIDGETLHNLQIKIDLISKSYQEFVDFEVDYDTARLRFYNPKSLVGGDFKVAYNPLWVRGLSEVDFPLKMDLWIETYKITSTGVYKIRYDTVNNEEVLGTFYELTDLNPMTQEKDGYKYYQFKTTVPPLDSIRKLVINEDSSDGGEELEEDSQFFVDYQTNTIRINRNINLFNDGDYITIHYTPNLTDDGLAIGYRLTRHRYNNITKEQVDDDDLNYDPDESHDYYIGMNSFTYRT